MKKLILFVILISGLFLATSAFAWTSWGFNGGFSNGGGSFVYSSGYCVNPPFYPPPVYIQPVVPMYYGSPMYYGGGYYRGRPHHRRYYHGRRPHHVPYYRRAERHGGYPRNPGPRNNNHRRRGW